MEMDSGEIADILTSAYVPLEWLDLPRSALMKYLAAVIATGLIVGPVAGSALAGTNVSFSVTSAFVTLAGGPGVYVAVTRSHGIITVSAS